MIEQRYRIWISKQILDDISTEDILSKISNETEAIKKVVSRFTQRFTNQDQFEYDILNNESLWKLSIPEESSGTCLTYNPKMESDPGYWYSMTIVPNAEDAMGSNFVEKKQNLQNDLNIFLHKPNKFFYFLEEDAPNNIKVDLKWMQLHNMSRLVGNDD